jgi:hypothetical protein
MYRKQVEQSVGYVISGLLHPKIVVVNTDFGFGLIIKSRLAPELLHMDENMSREY